MPKTSERIWCAIKDTVNYKRLSRYKLDDFPAIWLEIGTGKSSYYLCGLYREFTRPGNAKVSRRIANQRERFSRFNYARWIQNGNGKQGWRYAGLVEDLHEKLLNKGFVQLVNQVTRISGNVESILDLHVTNKPDLVERDHLTMKLTRSRDDQVSNPVIEGRSWRKADWYDLKKKIYTCHRETLRSICMV